MRRFRHLRRLTAMVTHLLLLQLAFASGAGACPPGSAGAHPAGMQMAGASAPEGQHHALNADSPATHSPASPAPDQHGRTQCDMACPPANCGSAGHCPVIATLDGVAPAYPFAPQRSAPPGAGDAVPHSVSRAPEPPPPRA